MSQKLKEMKSFIIKNMKSEEVRWNGEGDFYSCKYFSVKKNKSSDVEKFMIRFDNSYGEVSLNEIGISNFRYKNFLLPKIKSLVEKRNEIHKKKNIEDYWDTFLEKNKDINRDNKIDKILK